MSKSLLFDLKVLEFKLKESLEQYEKEKQKRILNYSKTVLMNCVLLSLRKKII